MLFRKNVSRYTLGLGHKLAKLLDGREAARREVPLLPSSWKELWSVYELQGAVRRDGKRAGRGHGHCKPGASTVHAG